MTIKKSVRLSDLSERLCLILSETGEPNYSGTLNKIAERYETIIGQTLPDLTQNEKLAICQCYNGYMKPERVRDQIAALEFTISEGYQWDDNVKELLIGAESADDLLGNDGSEIQTLLEKVRSWTIPERIAVIDMTERFWNGKN